MNSQNYLFREVLAKNPVLVGTIGLCPVVAICTSLKAALIMSVITLVTLIIAQLITSLVLKHLQQWMRLGLYTLIGMIVVIPSMILVDKFSPETMLALGIYLPLLAVNPLIVRNCEREAVETNIGRSLMTSICAGMGYSAVLIIVGFARELIGAGTVWGHKIPFIMPAESFLMPMGGFIVIAYLASILRIFLRKVDPELADELVTNSRTNIKGSKKAKVQLKGAKYADGAQGVPRRRKPEATPKRKRRRAASKPEPEKQAFEVMTLEEAEELRSANLPPVETTVQAELAPPTPEDPVVEAPAAPVSQRTSRFEFVTLDLGAEAKANGDAERFAAAVEESKAEQRKPQRRIRNRRGQEKQSRSVTAEEYIEPAEKEGEEE